MASIDKGVSAICRTRRNSERRSFCQNCTPIPTSAHTVATRSHAAVRHARLRHKPAWGTTLLRVIDPYLEIISDHVFLR
jgi:hypothetical protein